MKKIPLESASDDAIKKVLKIFSNLPQFYPKGYDENAVIEFSNVPILTDPIKKSTVDFIYKTTKNLINYHLQRNTDIVDTHFLSGNNMMDFFLKEKEFINSLHSSATSMLTNNFVNYESDLIILDKEQFIDKDKFREFGYTLNNLFSQELAKLKSHAAFDLLILCIDSHDEDANFIRKAGLQFIENKNIINNKNPLNENYVNNIDRYIKFFNIEGQEKDRVWDNLKDFLSERYVKDNQKDLIIYIDKIREPTPEISPDKKSENKKSYSPI